MKPVLRKTPAPIMLATTKPTPDQSPRDLLPVRTGGLLRPMTQYLSKRSAPAQELYAVSGDSDRARLCTRTDLCCGREKQPSLDLTNRRQPPLPPPLHT